MVTKEKKAAVKKLSHEAVKKILRDFTATIKKYQEKRDATLG